MLITELAFVFAELNHTTAKYNAEEQRLFNLSLDVENYYFLNNN